MGFGQQESFPLQGFAGHVMVVSYPSQGHINPLLEFAKRLAATNKIMVTFVNTHHSHERIAKNKSDSKSHSNPSSEIRFESFSDGLPEDFIRGSDHVLEEESIRVIGSQSFETLIEKLQNSGPSISCIVYDSFLYWIPRSAARFGIPCACLWTQSCAVLSLYLRAYTKGLSKVSNVEDLDLKAMNFSDALQVSDLPSFLQEFDRRDGMMKWFRNQVKHMIEGLHKPDWILGNSIQDLEIPETIWAMQSCGICTIGPLISPRFLGLDSTEGEESNAGNMWKAVDCKAWLDTKSQGSVVYVSFGSVSVLSQEQFHEIAMGLWESKHSFLWVIRKDEGVEYNALLPSGFLEETAGRGLVVGWCPQMEVLSHSAVGAFLSHCGWNSTLEALSQGVPILAAPQWTDQLTNSFYVSKVWKVGVKMARSSDGLLKREDIEKSIGIAMESQEGQEMMRNAAAMKEVARHAVMEGGSSHKNIQEFVDAVLARHPCVK